MNREKTAKTILAIDDEEDALFMLKCTLEQQGYQVETSSDSRHAEEIALRTNPAVILFDVSMPHIDGYQLTQQFKRHERLRYVPIILLTGKNLLEDVVSGFEAGANDYIVKPFEPELLVSRIHAAMRTREVYQELFEVHSSNKQLKRQLKEQTSLANVCGRSQAMQEVFNLIEKVAPTDVPVLITGESGTGKELVAHAVYAYSNRAANRLVIQNCSAISEQLLESELFGHVKGSFTGATKDKEGLFQAAHQGTFFLDELGEMSGALQAKLLRVLQDGSISPVGSTENLSVDVRIIAATHRDLPTLIDSGEFREDLYYRLNVVAIHLPPLRKRREDIPLLCERFLKKCANARNKKALTLSKDALKKLVDYDWPGNIRQLENEIRRADILCAGDEIEVADLSPALGAQSLDTRHLPNNKPSPLVCVNDDRKLKEAIEELEAGMIKSALDKTGGNKSEASRLLGISRSSLISKAQSYGLEKEV